MSDLEKKEFEFEGNKIIYFYKEKENAKKDFFLMHGYNFSTQTWIDVGLIDTIANSGYNVYSLDVPGFPKSVNKMKMENAEIEKLILNFINEKLNGKTSILGASASGHIALDFSQNYPENVEKLIVVDPVNPESVDYEKMNSIDILGIWGSEDPISKPIREVKTNIHIVIIKGAGHACYIDKPKEFNNSIKDFLEQKMH